MRMRALASSLVPVILAALVTGCGGPKDKEQALVDACARQLEELQENGSGTPEASSSEEAGENETLSECAGQDQVAADDAEAGEAGDDRSSSGSAEASGSEAGNDEGGSDEGAEGGLDTPELDPAARELFASSCGTCHQLADAKTTGNIGPNLDDEAYDAETVREQISSGGGGMPPNLLEGEDADAVAAYVAAASEQARGE